MDNKTGKSKQDVKNTAAENVQTANTSDDSATDNRKQDTAPKSALFTKNQLILSKKYENFKDALSVLLDDGRSYSFEETDKILDSFMKGKVV